ncbi:MAG: exopolysaccharide biosynthesis polyprenyl glycosylphosphotransferase [Lachnospiraceae bacterium]|nr:exopolysaccharide biosynthesis polyprenyl glycosylphosphotransferase [Lachnospiraceae bacterium]
MQKSNRQENLKGFYRFFAAVVLTVAVTSIYAYAWFNKINALASRPFLYRGSWMMVFLYAAIVVCVFLPFGAYKIGFSRKAHALLSQGWGLFLVNGIEFILTAIIIGRFRVLPEVVPAFVMMLAAQLLAVLVLTVSLTNIYRRFFPPFRMLQIHGDGESSLADKMNARDDKFWIRSQISAEVPLREIEHEIDRFDAVLLNDLPADLRNDILKYCFVHKKRVYFAPKISDILVVGSKEMNLFDSPLFLNKNADSLIYYQFVKRCMDIAIALVGILLTSPFMLASAAAIHMYDGGPVFYRQKRLTKDGKTFDIYKFRSMIVDAEKASGARLAAENDDRITPVGHFIRKTRIDELPQFFNILGGSMSVVGPRPERPEIHEEYCQRVPEFDYRLRVKAGLTGYAQVYGKYNTTTYDKLKFDLLYVEKASIWLDLQLILLTLRVIFQKEATEGV